jgi:uncharacterized protein (TIGR02118 family)
MIRVLAFIRRLPGVSRDAFRAHYEEIHVPIALPFLAGTVGYLRQHVREELHGAADFDCMTRFEYPDAAAVRAVFERTEAPQADAIRRDERTFMDKPAIVFFPVEEGLPWEATPPRAGPAHLVVCVRRPEGEKPARFRARFQETSLPALRAAAEDAGWCRPQFARSGMAQGAGFDAVTEIGAAGPGDLVRWARGLEAEGAGVIAVLVSVHETRMPG